MKIAVVGTRTFDNYELMCDILWPYKRCYGDSLNIISGGAAGADALAERWAEEWSVDFQKFPADWKLFGKSAGPKRNSEMVDAANMVICFWNQASTGSRDTIRKTLAANKPILIVPYKD